MDMDLSIFTPTLAGEFDLSVEDGRLAFWKQVLPQKEIHYTARDGSRQTLAFTEDYLHDLSTNKAVDKVPFLLADVNNAHTMDPERFRGDVVAWEIRDGHENPDHDGLYGKIVFPTPEAARAVLDNPDLGVSARIRENIETSDGSSISRGIIHVLGTLDPQVQGMSGWKTADLSNSSNTLDLTDQTYENGSSEMPEPKSIIDYTEAEIEAMDEDTLDAFLAQAATEYGDLLEADLDEVEDEDEDDEEFEDEEVDEDALVSLSVTDRREIDLANARATRALSELAQARWDKTKSAYLDEGVPPFLVDLAEPIFNRPSDFVVDLSNEGGDEINVGEIVSKLLDAAKGTIDLSGPIGHGGTFQAGSGEDPDKAMLDAWANQG